MIQNVKRLALSAYGSPNVEIEGMPTYLSMTIQYTSSSPVYLSFTREEAQELILLLQEAIGKAKQDENKQ